MRQITTIFLLVCAYILLFTTQAIAAKHVQSNNELVELDFAYGTCSDIDDPFEPLNRKIFMFNSVLDHFLLRPIAKGYNKMFDENTRDNIGNVFSNTKVPLTMVNNALQGEGNKTLLSFWQFVINSTLGVAGSHDVAKAQGISVEPQTLGSTLASYGFGPGPYIILPFYGMTNSRDMFDLLKANNVMNPVNYALGDNTKLAITAGTVVTERAYILPYTDHISKTSPDPYVAIRTMKHQNRESKVSYPSHYKCRNIKR
jgi:phospholipid-binding lipoprotein MlaA